MESRPPVTPLLKAELTATAGKQLVVLLAEVPTNDTGSGHYHPGSGDGAIMACRVAHARGEAIGATLAKVSVTSMASSADRLQRREHLPRPCYNAHASCIAAHR